MWYMIQTGAKSWPENRYFPEHLWLESDHSADRSDWGRQISLSDPDYNTDQYIKIVIHD